jgi:hypothetical protein
MVAMLVPGGSVRRVILMFVVCCLLEALPEPPSEESYQLSLNTGELQACDIIGMQYDTRRIGPDGLYRRLDTVGPVLHPWLDVWAWIESRPSPCWHCGLHAVLVLGL